VSRTEPNRKPVN